MNSRATLDLVATTVHHADTLVGCTATAEDKEKAFAKVTVAVATVDRPLQLTRCLTAILAGSTLPAEVVIVDQSSDLTAELVAAASSNQVVPVRYIRQARRGLAASRNAAIAHATQPLIVFTDDDCVPHWRWLTRIVAAFERDGQAAAVTGRILPLGLEANGMHAMSTHTSVVARDYRRRVLPWKTGSGANTAVRRAWLERLGGFNETLGCGSPGRSAEDVDLFYRLLAAGAMVRYEPNAVVFHERTDRLRRLATSFGYGFGMAAFCALWMRRFDVYAIWMLIGWLIDRARALCGACVRRRWWRIREELSMIRGVLPGLAYGFGGAPVLNRRDAAGLTGYVRALWRNNA
jgi:GT2 family glycosyltransferase